MNRSRCEWCGKDDLKLKRCCGCGVVKYCNASCQKAHWKVHKPFCVPVVLHTQNEFSKIPTSEPGIRKLYENYMQKIDSGQESHTVQCHARDYTFWCCILPKLMGSKLGFFVSESKMAAYDRITQTPSSIQLQMTPDYLAALREQFISQYPQFS